MGLSRALARVHCAYAGRIHARRRRTGPFRQGRFGAVATDEPHLAAALRHVARNPVRARLSERPEGWRWSSVHAHLAGAPDGITAIAPVLERFPDFAALIAEDDDPATDDRLRRAESIGRPLGDDPFLARLEAATGRTLKAGKRGPKPRGAETSDGERI